MWIARLLISQATAAKIRGRHQLDPLDVVDAVVCRPGLRATWDDDAERGRRAIVETDVGGRRLLVVLYPAGDDMYHLGSAYPF